MLKDVLKKALGIHGLSGVQPLKNMVHVGSKYHGYWIPDNFLNHDSVCYCIGAGEDISFDTELKIAYDCRLYIFDPTPEGKNHFLKLKEHTSLGKPLGVDGDSFTYRINSKQLDELVYVEKGVWDQDTVLRFYAPVIDNYVSHSVYLFKDSHDFIEAPVDRIRNFMKNLNHSTVDLVKMEIEGAEYTVLDTIIRDKLDVKMILVEFDEVFHANGFGYLFRIKKITDELRKAGYLLAHSTPQFKRTYIREDIYRQLLANQ
jgi:FkbM family methyltransferase